VAALGVLSTFALLVALEKHQVRWWALYAFAVTAAVCTHYIAVLTVVPQAAWALWAHRESVREQLISGALVVLACLPWLPSFIVQFRHSAGRSQADQRDRAVDALKLAEFSVKPLVAHPFIPLSKIPGGVPLRVLAAVFAGLFILLLYQAHRRGRRLRPRLTSGGGLVVLLALAPLVGLVLYSLRPSTSFLLTRNLAGAVPYALLLFGWLLTFPRPRLAAVLSVVALAALAVGTVKTLNPDHQRPDARDAARYIDAHGRPTAPVVDWPGPHAIRTYLEGSRPVHTVTEFGVSDCAAAVRARSEVFFTFPRVGDLARSLGPPAPYAQRYRLVAEHSSPGAPFEIGVREFAPR
jgi:hypothetical protein